MRNARRTAILSLLSVLAFTFQVEASASSAQQDGNAYTIGDSKPANSGVIRLAPIGSNQRIGPDRPAGSSVQGSAIARPATVRLPQDEKAKQDNQDVPVAPQTDDKNQQVGPPLSVPSNAATMPDCAYESDWCNLGCPKRLFGTTPGGTEVGGWLSWGFHTDDNGLFNSHDDRSRLNQGWIYAERKARRCCGLNFGFRFDGLYGVDAQDTQAFGNPTVGNPQGWDNDWDNGIYGWAIPQAYAEVAFNRVSIKAGKFFSPLGYERIAAKENFFYSRTFSRFYTNPFTHTGILATHQVSSKTEVYTGITTGWDTGFRQVGDALNYIGGVRFRPNRCLTLSYFTSGGDTGFRGDGWTHNWVAEMKLSRNFGTATEINYQDLGTNDEHSLAQYAIYKVNDCLSFGSRFEWYKSSRFTGVQNSTYSLTTGLNFRRSANMVVRPEVRVDWGAGAADPGNLIFGTDAVFTF